jgi:hypothetical protein
MSKTQVNTILSIEEALSLLDTHIEKRKKRVHTFQGGGSFLMGCDMDYSQIKRELKESFERNVDNICLAGPNMRGMQHGVAYVTKHNRWLFLATKTELINSMLLSRGIK